jgi:hypothetical protein
MQESRYRISYSHLKYLYTAQEFPMQKAKVLRYSKKKKFAAAAMIRRAGSPPSDSKKESPNSPGIMSFCEL